MGLPPSARQAEELVAAALSRQGWRVLARNFRRHGFELDLVARKGGTVAVIEVKARRMALQSGRMAEELISRGKAAALQRGAAAFLAEAGEECETLRFDLACVAPEQGQLRIRYFVGLDLGGMVPSN